MVSVSLVEHQYFTYCNLTTFDMGCTSFKILNRYVTPYQVSVSLNFRAQILKQANGDDSNIDIFSRKKIKTRAEKEGLSALI